MRDQAEQERIRRILHGDKDAFEPLVLENQKKIYNLALRMLGSREDALDLTQEAFLKAYRSLPTFRGESSFSVWLYRLAINLCTDFLRRKSKKREQSLTYPEEDGNEEADVSDMRNLPEEKLEQALLQDAVREGLKKLNREHRQILIMRTINGLSYEEIAQILGLELGTVKSRIARARVKLLKILQDDGNLFDSLPSDYTRDREE